MKTIKKISALLLPITAVLLCSYALWITPTLNGNGITENCPWVVWKKE